MTTSLILACVWAVTAIFLAMLPSKDHHWRAAYVLMTIGAPLLVYIAWENGMWTALICLLGAGSILRWPVIYFWRWIKRKLKGEATG